jgi:hypothetical protein
MNFRNKLIFLRLGIVSPTPNPQAGGPPLVGCPRLFVQYIRSYPPYLEAVSSICNLRTHYAVVTRDPCNMVLLVSFDKYQMYKVTTLLCSHPNVVTEVEMYELMKLFSSYQ